MARDNSSRPYVQVLSSIFTLVTLSVGTHVSAASAGFTSEMGRPLNWTLWLTCPARLTVESPMRAYRRRGNAARLIAALDVRNHVLRDGARRRLTHWAGRGCAGLSIRRAIPILQAADDGQQRLRVCCRLRCRRRLGIRRLRRRSEACDHACPAGSNDDVSHGCCLLHRSPHGGLRFLPGPLLTKSRIHARPVSLHGQPGVAPSRSDRDDDNGWGDVEHKHTQWSRWRWPSTCN